MTQPNRRTHRPKPATAWRPSLALAALLLLVACGGPGGPVASVDAFVAALPGWDEVAPPVVENTGEPTGGAPVIDQETVDGIAYSCSTTPYSIAKNPAEMALFNPDASVLWPGALIRGGSHLNVGSLELLAVSRERRAPLGISIQGGGVLGIPGGVSTIVAEPVGSTIREGINQLVVNALGADVAVGAGASTFTSVESHSTSQTLLKLGLDARYLGAEASARLDYSKNASQRTYTAYFVQRLFTIAVDLPERASSLFADGVTGADLQALGISGSNLPLYIDSVSYGRILMFSFTSSASRERIAAALEFSYDSPIGGVDGFAETDLRQTLSSARIEVFALGGPNTGVQNLIRDGSLASYFEAPLAINQVEPISFTLRNLGDNRLAKVGDTTSYDVRTCLPVGGGLPQPKHWWPANGDASDAVGDVDLGGFGGVYGAGWNGSDPAQRSWVLDGAGQYLSSWPIERIVPTDGPFTVSAWINPRATVGPHTIISQVGGQLRAGDFALRIYGGDPNGRLQFWRRGSAGSGANEVVVSGLIVPKNAWSHVVAVYGSTGGGGALQVYVNGNPVGGGVSSGNYSNCLSPTFLTMTRVGSSELCENAVDGVFRRFPFDGSIDELMLFDRALTASEVLAMYQNFAHYQP